MRSFWSDNHAGICPEALEAMVRAAGAGHAPAYGNDADTEAAVDVFREILGPRTSVWFVATGTAANTLAIASLTEPWQQVVCHEHSHYNDDESTGPERFTGCRVVQVRNDSSKLTPADLQRAMRRGRGDVHQPQPGVVTISNPTEFGTVYTPQETSDLCKVAHAAGYRVHVDGARFANAVASLGCDPRALAGDAGVDALSFGGTKNGLACGEAVCFFPQGDESDWARAVETFPFHRKGAGHLLSKHRFVAAPFAATLREGIWLRHAAHANVMARRLADGLARLDWPGRFPTEANGVFLSMPSSMAEALRQAGHGLYPFGDPDWSLVRFMCSYDTEPGDVDALLADVGMMKKSD